MSHLSPQSPESQAGVAVARQCPVCGQNDFKPYLQKGELRLVRCCQCDMVYASPVHPDLSSGKFYDDAGADYYLSAAKLEGDYAAVRSERELRCFLRHCRRGRVLDVGCSSGGFLFALNRAASGCFDTLGVDISGPALDYAESRGLRVLRGDFPGHDFGEERFEAVTFWAVLEHLVEPRRFLEKARSVLQPGGLCFVLVPNLGSLAVRWLGARYRYILPQHVNYFTKRTLLGLMSEGFHVSECRATHFNPAVLWQDWRSPQPARSGLERAELLRRTNAWKRNPWLLPVRAGYRACEGVLSMCGLADNLMLVARKTG